MTADVSMREIEPGDTKNDILNTLAAGRPWVFLSASVDDDGIDMSVETGGGVRDVATIRKMLTLTLDALPGPE